MSAEELSIELKKELSLQKAQYIHDIESDLLNALQKNNKELQRGLLANYWVMQSPITIDNDIVVDKIVLITQFYISSNSERQKEIVECLSRNIANSNIDKIYLVIERL